MNKQRILDGIAIVWLAVAGYLSSIGAGLVSFQGSSWWWLSSPLLLVPAVAWLGWSIYQKEGHGPARVTTEGVAFVLGIIMLVMHYPPVAEALSRIL